MGDDFPPFRHGEARRYDHDGVRITTCCGAYSTFDQDGILYCKACFSPVPAGQGDGTEYRGDFDMNITGVRVQRLDTGDDVDPASVPAVVAKAFDSIATAFERAGGNLSIGPNHLRLVKDERRDGDPA